MDTSAAETAKLYREWARVEAHGSSLIYERLALAVAENPAILEFLSKVEPAKRQPNLLFGALRWHNVTVDDPAEALAWLLEHQDAVLAVMRNRRTQTNEVARCATLLPALALLPQPLALIEVGASAGLCLLYDSWRYHYTGSRVDRWVGPTKSPLTLSCITTGDVPVPQQVPAIIWRAGLDLNPIDAADPDARRWLQALIWPEHHERADRLDAALAVAALAAPRIVAGDLVSDLPKLLDQAPTGATVVVTHSATLAYLDRTSATHSSPCSPTPGCTGSAPRAHACCRTSRSKSPTMATSTDALWCPWTTARSPLLSHTAGPSPGSDLIAVPDE